MKKKLSLFFILFAFARVSFAQCNFWLTAAPSAWCQCNGNAYVNSWGTPPFAYLWSTGDTVDYITGLCPGMYTVTVTDSNGCVHSDSVLVPEVPPATFSFNITPASCDSCCDGSVQVIIGCPISFTATWLDSAFNPDSACNGTYEVNIVDQNGCPYDYWVTIGVAAGMENAVAVPLKIHTEGHKLVANKNWKRIEIYDLAGKLIREENTVSHEIVLPEELNGIFLVRGIDPEGNNFSAKLFL